ncbi:Reverse transcriptase [Theobroma cacao]|nr:Reverse transcriptase [Theobroma cacao]
MQIVPVQEPFTAMPIPLPIMDQEIQNDKNSSSPLNSPSSIENRLELFSIHNVPQPEFFETIDPIKNPTQQIQNCSSRPIHIKMFLAHFNDFHVDLPGNSKGPSYTNTKAVSSGDDRVCRLLDTSLFLHHKGTSFTTILAYVDDVIIATKDISHTEALKQYLKAWFPIKDLGNLKYFLGLEVARCRDGIAFVNENIHWTFYEKQVCLLPSCPCGSTKSAPAWAACGALGMTHRCTACAGRGGTRLTSAKDAQLASAGRTSLKCTQHVRLVQQALEWRL